MKYVCLVHFAPDALSSLTDEEKRTLDARSTAYDEELSAGGHLLAAEALQSPDSAVLVKVRGGQVSTTDGPFAETKELLGGFLLIEARDLNEAIRIASGIPLAALGTIEVRPIYEIPTPEGGGR
ncbi:YciI family protein [Sorangium sp. So ce1036]|uniref:YciI family protein n=1 Tax=Sorangium sp. So ce1036 TaxID=3133328 RepID=UPI003F06D0E2